MNIVAYKISKNNGSLLVEDSEGEHIISNKPSDILGFIIEPYENTYKVVWDVKEFISYIIQLLPSNISESLQNGDRVEYNGFRLWLGTTRHGYIFGVSYKEIVNIKGNIYKQKVYDADIYELQQYFPGEAVVLDVFKVADKGDYLLSVLERMGLNPRRLTSAASIYKECVLDKMPIPTIWNMPEECLPMMEMATNYVREWHGDYQSGDWDKERTYKYDLTSAYPSVLAEMPNLAYAKYLPYDKCCKYDWAILKGRLKLTNLLSPVVDGHGKNLYGEYDDAVISSYDWDCINRWHLGAFEPQSGWALVVEKDVKIFGYIMRRLYDYRGGNPIRDALAKAMAVSVWGKFLEMHGEEYGDYFNGIYASMVTSKVRARVCDFIYEHNLQDDVLEITVDGVRTKKLISVTTQRKFGEWRIV